MLMKLISRLKYSKIKIFYLRNVHNMRALHFLLQDWEIRNMV